MIGALTGLGSLSSVSCNDEVSGLRAVLSQQPHDQMDGLTLVRRCTFVRTSIIESCILFDFELTILATPSGTIASDPFAFTCEGVSRCVSVFCQCRRLWQWLHRQNMVLVNHLERFNNAISQILFWLDLIIPRWILQVYRILILRRNGRSKEKFRILSMRSIFLT